MTLPRRRCPACPTAPHRLGTGTDTNEATDDTTMTMAKFAWILWFSFAEKSLFSWSFADTTMGRWYKRGSWREVVTLYEGSFSQDDGPLARERKGLDWEDGVCFGFDIRQMYMCFA